MGGNFSAYHIFYLLESDFKCMHEVFHEFHKYLGTCCIQKLQKFNPWIPKGLEIILAGTEHKWTFVNVCPPGNFLEEATSTSTGTQEGNSN